LESAWAKGDPAEFSSSLEQATSPIARTAAAASIVTRRLWLRDVMEKRIYKSPRMTNADKAPGPAPPTTDNEKLL
jgi:hypothetical protein